MIDASYYKQSCCQAARHPRPASLCTAYHPNYHFYHCTTTSLTGLSVSTHAVRLNATFIMHATAQHPHPRFRYCTTAHCQSLHSYSHLFRYCTTKSITGLSVSICMLAVSKLEAAQMAGQSLYSLSLLVSTAR